jgi:hypothetical protein
LTFDDVKVWLVVGGGGEYVELEQALTPKKTNAKAKPKIPAVQILFFVMTESPFLSVSALSDTPPPESRRAARRHAGLFRFPFSPRR